MHPTPLLDTSVASIVSGAATDTGAVHTYGDGAANAKVGAIEIGKEGTRLHHHRKLVKGKGVPSCQQYVGTIRIISFGMSASQTVESCSPTEVTPVTKV